MKRPNPFFELRKELPIIFWPVLFLSLKWFIGYVAELRAAGHQAIKWHVTWYGVIKVTWVDTVDTVDPLRDLKALPRWEDVQAKLAIDLSFKSRVPSERWDLRRLAGLLARMTPAAIGPSFRWGYGSWGVCGKKLEPG